MRQICRSFRVSYFTMGHAIRAYRDKTLALRDQSEREPFYHIEVVPCTITYTLPIIKKKK